MIVLAAATRLKKVPALPAVIKAAATKAFGEEIPKGDFVGTDKASHCQDNTIRHRHDHEMYVGVAIFFDSEYKRWTSAEHAFNVKDGKVVEFTRMEEDWSSFHYFGYKVTGPFKKWVQPTRAKLKAVSTALISTWKKP